MLSGVIIKALSGFYYVAADEGEAVVRCRARGKFRLDGLSPLVGDRVEFTETEPGIGTISAIKPRINSFYRPAVANVDPLVIVASETIPRTDPYLIDRMAAIAAVSVCGVVICVNKSDLSQSSRLADIYSAAGFEVIVTSAVTGEGIEELRRVISGKTSVFTGNSGVGKSSILNAMDVKFDIETDDVSQKLGRGRHTTRHVELYSLGGNTYIADTPGFASFDVERVAQIRKEQLPYGFIEFKPYLGGCYFNDCAHINEPGCAVLEAISDGKIGKSRHDSYVRLHEIASRLNEWELDK